MLLKNPDLLQEQIICIPRPIKYLYLRHLPNGTNTWRITTIITTMMKCETVNIWITILHKFLCSAHTPVLQSSEIQALHFMKGERWYTFFEGGLFGSLSTGENGLHVDSHISFGGIPSTDDAEAETLLSAAFLVCDRINVQWQRFRSLGVRLGFRRRFMPLRRKRVPLWMRRSAAARCTDFGYSVTIVIVFRDGFYIHLLSNKKTRRFIDVHALFFKSYA